VIKTSTMVARGGVFSKEGLGSGRATGDGILGSGACTRYAGGGVLAEGMVGFVPAYGVGVPAMCFEGMCALGGSTLSGNTYSAAGAVSYVATGGGVCGSAPAPWLVLVVVG
jgi:hypothetical protein